MCARVCAHVCVCARVYMHVYTCVCVCILLYAFNVVRHHHLLLPRPPLPVCSPLTIHAAPAGRPASAAPAPCTASQSHPQCLQAAWRHAYAVVKRQRQDEDAHISPLPSTTADLKRLLSFVVIFYGFTRSPSLFPRPESSLLPSDTFHSILRPSCICAHALPRPARLRCVCSHA